MGNNAYIVARKFMEKGYINKIYDLNCDYRNDELNVTFDNGWYALRCQIWDIYKQFPFTLLFANTLEYKEPMYPTALEPVEPLTAELLTSMEQNLCNMYVYADIIGLNYEHIPIKLSENKIYRKITRWFQ